MSEHPYGYRAYGLVIRSELLLPELDPDDAGVPDLTIRYQSTGCALPASGEGAYEYRSDSQYLAWPGVGAFLIRGVDSIDIEPAPGVSKPLLNFALLGPVMALLLHLRGMLVLHASALDVGGLGAVFLGDKGAGKSTTAAALVSAGHRLLTDDVLAVDFSDPCGPRIVPGFPTLKLRVDAAKEVLSGGAVTMPPPTPDFPKQQRRLTGSFAHSRISPTGIYVLTRGSSGSARPLSAQDALSALMRFSFLPRFKDRPLARAEAAAHLRQCAALAGAVPVCRLEVPGDLDRLADVVRLIESDLS